MMRKIFMASALASALLTAPLRAAFQNPGWSARAEGMGGVFCALGGDASSIFYNPASIMALTAPEFVLMGFKPYMSLSGVEWKYYQFSAVYPKESFTMGMAYSGFNAQSLYFENSFLLSGAFSRRRMDMGGSLKYLSHSYNLPHEMQPFFDSTGSSGISADLGAVFRMNGTFSAGLAVENIIPADMGIKYDDPVPSIYKIGFAAQAPEFALFQDVRAGLDISYRDQDWGDRLNWGIGAEVWFANKSLALRCGYSVSEINMGASFVVEDRRTGLDYSFSLPLELSDNAGSHRIQMVFRFFRSDEQILRDDLEGIRVPVRRVGESDKKDVAAPASSPTGAISEVYPEEIPPAVSEPEPAEPVIEKAEPEAAAPAEVSDMDEEIRRMEQMIFGDAAEPKTMTAEEKAMAGEHFNKATEFFTQGRYESAISEWQQVLIINPGHELSKQKIDRAKALAEGE